MAETARAARLEYAPRGLIGCLTPQANTTVEPEFNIMLPPGFALLNARLTSSAQTIEARLVDYMQGVEQHCHQFGNAPVEAIALATTGASYLVGRQREDTLVDAIRGQLGIALVTSARAVCDALVALAVTRIALVSPYPHALTARSVAYWRSRGLDVVAVESVYEESASFHPIYSLRANVADGALETLRDSGAGAIVLLGTGLPTLRPIAARAGWDGPPVLSCMLCLAWRTVRAVEERSGAGGAQELREWIAATGWRARLPTAPADRG